MLTSTPTPKVKIRRWCGFPFRASSRIAASDVCPTVGNPSVMNKTIGSVPSVGGCLRASSRASWILVPPLAVIPLRNSVALWIVAGDLRTGRSANGWTPSL